MQSRRDQLHAYRFQARRAVAALVLGQPDVVEPPMRRLTATTLAGVLIAIIVAAGFAVVGLIRPAATDAWRRPGAVIVEEETGARLILVDGTLHPVLNYTSALLALGQAGASAVVTPRAALRDVPRGAAIGIAGLPDSLPAQGDLVSSPWLTCTRASRSAINVSSVAVSAYGGVDAAGTPIERGTAVLVTSPDGSARHLLIGGRRLLIGGDAVAAALRLDREQALPVGSAFLASLPEASPLVAPAVPDAGAAGPVIGAARPQVGQVVDVTGSDAHYLVLSDGLAPLMPLPASLLGTLTVAGRILPALQVDASAVLQAPKSALGWAPPADWPDEVPAIDPEPARVGAVCARFDAGDGGASSLVVPADASAPNQRIVAPVQESARSAAGQADSVRLARSSAAIARSDSGAATVYLIAGSGQKFPMEPEVLPLLGYADPPVIVLPAQFLQLAPTGPALDPVAARREAPVAGPAPAPS